jgi:hypothetical protein
LPEPAARLVPLVAEKVDALLIVANAVFTVTVIVPSAVTPALVPRIVRVAVAVCVGVPEILPVPASSVSPAGTVPL